MKRGETPLQTHRIHLVEGDFEALRDLVPGVTPSVFIRNLVHRAVLALQKKREDQVSDINVGDSLDV